MEKKTGERLKPLQILNSFVCCIIEMNKVADKNGEYCISKMEKNADGNLKHRWLPESAAA